MRLKLLIFPTVLCTVKTCSELPEGERMSAVSEEDIAGLTLRQLVAFTWDCVGHVLLDVHPPAERLYRRDLDVVSQWCAGDDTKRGLWYTEGNFAPYPAPLSFDQYVQADKGDASRYALGAYKNARRLFVFARDYRGGREDDLRLETAVVGLTLHWLAIARHEHEGIYPAADEIDWQHDRLLAYTS